MDTRILEPYKPKYLNDKTFLLHVTIGNFTSRDNLNKAFKDASVNKERFTIIFLYNLCTMKLC
ncbi:hypothetical protein [Clostridium sp.]|uniref:hypothetical protein n=1 Tax=Clostridium sp. TaxID=1506 RepID=UPI001ED5EA5B|nr:hypothetical protein [Clostridium sp.]MBS5883724.1 hypothetical protein [Clostridium sp.]